MSLRSNLPAGASLDSLRAQARTRLREAASLRDARLAVAREYGFPGWKELEEEIRRRQGGELERAVFAARRLIHDNDTEALRRLLAAVPALLSWRAEGDEFGLLGMATRSYGDSGDAFREAHFTRPDCAELLLDAGAFVAPGVCEDLLRSRARGLIDLFRRRGLLPETLGFLAALGDGGSVRARLESGSEDLPAVNEAMRLAFHLHQEEAATLLLEHSIWRDTALADRIDSGPGRASFIRFFLEHRPDVFDKEPFDPWEAYAKQRITVALDGDALPSFVEGLRQESWLLAERYAPFHARLIERAAMLGRPQFIDALIDLAPTLQQGRTPPRTTAFATAFTYAKANVVPALLRIWPAPLDLPHTAGSGDLAAVKGWFGDEGALALGSAANHYPVNDAQYRDDFRAWFGDDPGEQEVLDTALAWAVLNNHFEVADFLLAHGADIDTSWSSHEPASILHELVWHKNYGAMEFLIRRGIDPAIHDFRWRATAAGWAEHAAGDAAMAQWLREAPMLL